MWCKVMKVLGGKSLRQKISQLDCDREKYEEVKNKLKEEFSEKRNLNSLRQELFSMKQNENETTRKWMERCK